MDANVVSFECPHCGRPQTKTIPKMADVEVKCMLCKGSIGVVTNCDGDPIRIGQLTSLSKLLNSSQKQDVMTNPSGVIKAGNYQIGVLGLATINSPDGTEMSNSQTLWMPITIR